MSQLPRPLRLLLLVDSLEQPAWVEWMLRDVVDARVAEIVGVAINTPATSSEPDAPATAARAGRVGRLARNWRAIPMGVLERIDRPRLAIPDPLQPRSLDSLVTGVPAVAVTPRCTKFSDFLSDEDVERLKALDADVAIRLGFRILRGRSLEVARHGVWSFHHGDSRRYRGGPPAFWEVVESEPATGAILQRLSEDLDGGEVLFRTCVPTDPVSPARNRAHLCWAAAHGLRHALSRLQRGVRCATSEDRVVPYGRAMYTPPQGWQAVSVLARLLLRRVRSRLLRRRPFQWRLAWRHDPTRAGSTIPDLAPHRFHVVPAPSGALQADPFVVAQGDRHLIFFEDVPPGGTDGRIALTVLERGKQPSAPELVLSRDYHLSYPTVFEWDGDWYMVPETYAAGAQEVFRATRFPDQWTLHARWFEGDPIVDPTIVEHDGRWWLLASRPVPQTLVGDELFVYHATSPLGPWLPHLQNPVRSGVDGSRPAGIPFRAGDSLIRPAQFGAPHYGASIRFWAVETLSPEQFVERPVGTIDPAWSHHVRGFHTLNSAGTVTVGDVLVTDRSPWVV